LLRTVGESIDRCVGASDDVCLTTVGFPRAEYCHCERCTTTFAASDIDDWAARRASMITDFVAAVAARVPGRLYLTLHPDPYPGHLFERAGLDLAVLDELVDAFVVPL
jgi:hypothetical protein